MSLCVSDMPSINCEFAHSLLRKYRSRTSCRIVYKAKNSTPKVTILGDSTFRLWRASPEYSVQVEHGLTLTNLRYNIKYGLFKTTGFDVIILHVGHRDAQTESVTTIVKRLFDVVYQLKNSFPAPQVVVSSVITRPCDYECSVAKKIKQLNSKLEKSCKKK